MSKYKVHCFWQMSGYHLVEANTPEEAAEIAEYLDLPDNSEYVTDSFEVEYELTQKVIEKEKPNCYKCIYRQSIPGDAHSRCTHPNIYKDNEELTGLSELVTLLNSHLGIMWMKENNLNVTGNEHGIQNCWFNWPWNYDPIWLLTCSGYTKKDNEE